MTTNLAPRLARARNEPSSRAIAFSMALALVACAPARVPAPAEFAPFGALPDASVEVRLVFGPAADLDLFVSDPNQETVYFGNNPSRGGGRLSSDRRCDSPVPRIEVVTFENARPGRYRVSIDYAATCGLTRGPVPFRVEAGAGARAPQWHAEGEISAGRFETSVLEFEVEAKPAPP